MVCMITMCELTVQKLTLQIKKVSTTVSAQLKFCCEKGHRDRDKSSGTNKAYIQLKRWHGESIHEVGDKEN